MRAFKLKVEHGSAVQTLDFEGEDPHEAFALLERGDEPQRASIWQGDECLGTVTRDDGGVWVVTSSAPDQAEG